MLKFRLLFLSHVTSDFGQFLSRRLVSSITLWIKWGFLKVCTNRQYF